MHERAVAAASPKPARKMSRSGSQPATLTRPAALTSALGWGGLVW
ncbi:hypothetical protein KZZ52_59285 [Dactylosporangium sp. AC04546]|nr:hypothetical protein [Dactylosporangium sp. AC04546]WVK83727.1 hypothetical protein KZZ52_59285 [Dactylosporangium sp. AC04546]